MYWNITFLAWVVQMLLGATWAYIDTQVRRLEPYFMLSRPNGATAKESICLDLTATWVFMVPIHAIAGGLQRRYLVFLSSILAITAGILVPTIHSVIWREYAPLKGLEIVVILFNGIVAILGLGLQYLLSKQKTGLHDDFDNLGGLAALICDSNIPEILQHSSLLNMSQIADAIENCRLCFAHITKTNPKTHQVYSTYQLVMRTDPPYPQPIPLLAISPHDLSAAGFNKGYRILLTAHPLVLTLPFAILLEAILLMPTITSFQTAYMYIESSRALELSPVILLGNLLAASMVLSVLQAACAMAPWWALQKGPQLGFQYPFGPDRRWLNRRFLVQNNQGGWALINIFQSLGFRAIIVSLTSLRYICLVVGGIILPEDIAFRLPGFRPEPPGSRSQSRYNIFNLFLSSFFIAWLCLELLLWAPILVYSKPILPRAPGSIASRLAYICHSEKLLNDLRGVDMKSIKAVDKRLAECSGESKDCPYDGHGYGLGWVNFLGSDGVRRWKIAVERGPLTGRYSFGQWEPDDNDYKASVRIETARREEAAKKKKLLEAKKMQPRRILGLVQDVTRSVTSEGEVADRPQPGMVRDRPWWHHI